MLRILLIRPGCTDFDTQQRIKGSLDLPLSDEGETQAARTAGELSTVHIDALYSSPCQAAQQTADLVAVSQQLRVKSLDALRNLDHGLWHGKLISEVKQKQPKVYRQWQDRPETVCPPGGETVQDARERVERMLLKLVKKHRDGVVALVVSEPLASMIRSCLIDSELGDLWQAARDCGSWEMIVVDPERAGRTARV